MGRPHWNIEGGDLMVKVHTTWDDLIGTSRGVTSWYRYTLRGTTSLEHRGGDTMVQVHTTWDDLIGTSRGGDTMVKVHTTWDDLIGTSRGVTSW